MIDKSDQAAEGCIVAPGVVDLHTHYDAQLNWAPYASGRGSTDKKTPGDALTRRIQHRNSHCHTTLFDHPGIATIEHLLQITWARALDGERFLLLHNAIIRWPLYRP